MRIHKALARLDELEEHELRALASNLRHEIENYVEAIRNYPPDRMAKHGEPHLKRLKDRLAKVNERLNDGE